MVTYEQLENMEGNFDIIKTTNNNGVVNTVFICEVITKGQAIAILSELNK